MRVFDVFLVFLRLGLTSFGGPVAHLGYFREEFVVRRRWLSDQSFADLVALCQFLPGPASSQVGIAVGLSRAGFPGAVAAWTGFTLPSAIALMTFAVVLPNSAGAISTGVLHGLKLVAVAVVAQAVWGMAKLLVTDATRALIMLSAAALIFFWSAALAQLVTIAGAGVVGLWFCRATTDAGHDALPFTIRKRTGVALLLFLLVLLVGLPLLATVWPSVNLARISSFFRVGSLVFGGGHVVLPMLQHEVVRTGWVTTDTFLAGYGAAQAVPGPLFSFAAFLGASMTTGLGGWIGGFIMLVAMFAPSFLLVMGVLPFWEQLRANTRVRGALAGVNAAVVGLLLVALYRPVWTSAVFSVGDVVWAGAALAALMVGRVPPWAVVLLSGIAGWLLGHA